MNLGTELQYTLASFIGFMLESICYGIYCVIFAAFVRIRLKRRKHDESKAAFLYLNTANFIACTAFLAVDVTASQSIASLGVLLASNALYTCVDFISQVILVYRCWIIWRQPWERQPWVMVVPILLTLAFLVISVASLAEFPSVYADPSQAANVFYPLVLSFFSLSLAENALVTGLIIFKILAVYRDIQGFQANGLGRGLGPIISILIESGVITFMAQLVLTLIYKFDNFAYPIICGLVVQLYGISTAIVIVRVEMGLTYDSDVDNLNLNEIHFAASNNDAPLP